MFKSGCCALCDDTYGGTRKDQRMSISNEHFRPGDVVQLTGQTWLVYGMGNAIVEIEDTPDGIGDFHYNGSVFAIFVEHDDDYSATLIKGATETQYLAIRGGLADWELDLLYADDTPIFRSLLNR